VWGFGQDAEKEIWGRSGALQCETRFVDEVGREHHVMFRLSPWATVVVDVTT
jgi:hypothetical protein